MSLRFALRFRHHRPVMEGAGAEASVTAPFMLVAHRTRDARLVAPVAGIVVIAGAMSTENAAIAQPLTGLALAHRVGWPLGEGWLLASIALYGVIGLFRLPVVAIQLRMHDLERAAAAKGGLLPPAYDKLFRIWSACGWSAFAAMLAILWLMTAKPSPG